MADKSILCQKDMVRAILENRKTETRRVIKPQPFWDGNEWALYAGGFTGNFSAMTMALKGNSSIQHGDRLYVREAWRAEHCYNGIPPTDIEPRCPVFYEADSSEALKSNLGRFRQGMHMPKWASRITLIVNTVRVQRLTDISQKDAVAEGIDRANRFTGDPRYRNYINPDKSAGEWDPRKSFQSLWDSINADRGFGWDKNPWVAAYTFTPIFKNILEVKHDNT